MTENTLMPLAGFIVGYAAILITPGPNLFSIGAIAALRGLRATLPLCLGIALGASVLAVGICTAVSLGRHSPMVEQLSRAAAFALLLYVAAQLLFRQPPKAIGKQALELSARDAIATFLAGVSTAVTNPITAAFFASQFLGALPDRTTRILALGLVPCLAMSFGVTLGFALSRPFAQRAATVWHRPIRFLAAAVLATTALIVAVPVLGGAPGIEPGSTASADQVIERPLQRPL